MAIFTEGQLTVGSVLRVFGVTVAAAEGPMAVTIDTTNNAFIVESLGAGFEWNVDGVNYNVSVQ